MLVALFFFLRDGNRIVDQLIAISPLGKRHTEALLCAARDAILASLYGVGGVALAQAGARTFESRL
jgi:predicted PurR-regulated permease PerM